MAETDRVALLDGENLQPIFPNASPMQASVRNTSKYTSYVVESGEEINDGHRVINPVEIDVMVALTIDARSVYDTIYQAWLSGRKFQIQGKMRSYPDMYLQDMPHDETIDTGNGAMVQLKFKEVRVGNIEFGTLPPRKVANKNQADSVKKGNQQTTESTPATKRKGQSVLFGVFN